MGRMSEDLRALLLAVLFLEIIAAFFIIPRLHSGGTAQNAGTAPVGSGGSDNLQRHINRAAGYSFSYPGNWIVTDHDQVSQATSPDHHAVVTFAPVPARGDTFSSSQQLTNVLSRSYAQFRLLDRNATYLNGHDAISVEGKAVSTHQVPIRLYAAALTGDGRRYGAIGFWSIPSQSKQVSQVRQTVRSFQTGA